MSEKIIVIGDEETATGFMLLGIECIISKDFDKEALGILQRADVGMLIVQLSLLSQASHKLKKLLEASTKPVVLMIPGRKDKGEAGDELAKMVKKIIGI